MLAAVENILTPNIASVIGAYRQRPSRISLYRISWHAVGRLLTYGEAYAENYLASNCVRNCQHLLDEFPELHTQTSYINQRSRLSAARLLAIAAIAEPGIAGNSK